MLTGDRKQKSNLEKPNFYQLQQNIFRQPEVKGGRAKDPPGKFDFESTKSFSNHLTKNIFQRSAVCLQNC